MWYVFLTSCSVYSMFHAPKSPVNWFGRRPRCPFGCGSSLHKVRDDFLSSYDSKIFHNIPDTGRCWLFRFVSSFTSRILLHFWNAASRKLKEWRMKKDEYIFNSYWREGYLINYSYFSMIVMKVTERQTSMKFSTRSPCERGNSSIWKLCIQILNQRRTCDSAT